MSTNTVTIEPHGFEQIPYEIRQMIFSRFDPEDLCIKTFSEQGMPAIITAFRSLPLSYDHLLQFFGKVEHTIHVVLM